MKRFAVVVSVIGLLLAAKARADQPFQIHEVAEGSHPAIAFDDKGQLSVAMERFSKDLKQINMFYVGSVDGGWTWTTPLEISALGKSSIADIVVDSKGVINVAWGYTSAAGDISGIFVARSLDGGATWARPLNISNTPGQSSEPDVGVGTDDSLHVVWTDKSAGEKHSQIYYCSSKDSGVTWSKAVNIDNTSGAAGEPAIAAGEDGSVYVAWSETPSGGDHPNIYFARKTAGGWLRPINISNSLHATSHPDITCGEKGKVHVCWAEGSGTANARDICYTQCNSRGHFGDVLDLSDTGGVSSDPALVSDHGRVAVVWSHEANGSTTSEILGRASLDDGKHFSPDVGFSSKEASCIHPDVAISGDSLYVVWEESSPLKSIIKSTSLEIEVVSPAKQ